MRVIAFNQYGPPEVFREDELSIPEPGPNEVLVKVHATSVNRMDWQIRSKQSGVQRPGFPQVLGFDVSGVVAEVGEEVIDSAVGDEVYGMVSYTKDGANAEYVRTLAAYMRPKPESLSHLEAASLPMVGLAALQGMKLRGGLKSGERILITGASGEIGSVAVQFAKNFGAHVTATCDAANCDTVSGLGADEVIAYDTGQIPDDARFDLIFDTVKSFDFGTASSYLTRAGRYVCTVPDALGPIKSRLGWLTGKRQKCLYAAVQPDPQALDYMSKMVAAGTLRPLIAQSFPITELAAAHTLGEAGGVVGKIVIEVSPHFDEPPAFGYLPAQAFPPGPSLVGD